MKKSIIAILVVAFVIVGCRGGTGGEGRIVSRDIYKGTNGLVMEFLPMPEDVFEKSPFRMEVKLKNEGAYDITQGYLTLGLEKDFIGLSEWAIREPIIGVVSSEQVEFNLEGKSIMNPKGSQGMVAVILASKEIEVMREKHTSTILFTGCYAYKTKLSEGVCIDTDILGTRTVEKACKVEDKTLEGQGAPIAITKVEVDMLPHENKVKPQFLIYIENKKKGEVVKTDVVREACSGEPIDFKDFNVVKVSAKLFDKPLTCTPSTAKLKEGKDEIRCILDEGISKDEGTHTETLNLELDYGYTNTMSTTIDIKKLPT
ncbi:hypothetical protein KY360_00865 [Candidatus Woesearchaeota archaeon]|nr:hypothetical protein [Candidatus Woesearchaeota archaeon]